MKLVFDRVIADDGTATSSPCAQHLRQERMNGQRWQSYRGAAPPPLSWVGGACARYRGRTLRQVPWPRSSEVETDDAVGRGENK